MLTGQFLNLPVGLLVGSAALSAMTGGLADAGLILGVVVLNAGIGFVTELKSEKTIRSLKEERVGSVKVIRQGDVKIIPATHLVPGDLIWLKEGEVPADVRLLKVKNLKADESSLTGESLPVSKHAGVLSPGTVLGDRGNQLYKGTVITGGQGRGLVVATGQTTELGKITTLSASSETPTTPLQQDLEKLGRQVVWGSMGICAGVFAIGVLRGQGVVSMLNSAISLAIAAVPEGLPAVGTTAMAMGVYKLRKRDIYARSLEGVESLGHVDTFCFDKTGTLTLNEMQVVSIATPQGEVADDSLEGLWAQTGSEAVNLQHFMKIAYLCNDTIVKKGRYKGSATEVALYRWAEQGGASNLVDGSYSRTGVRYRSEESQMMKTKHQGPDGEIYVAVKGNPADLIEACDWYMDGNVSLPMTPEIRGMVQRQNEKQAGEGLRVLGFAFGVGEDKRLTWIGLAALKDPIRSGVKGMIQKFHRAGIRPVMLTGDQELTAESIAKELDFENGQKLIVAPKGWLTRLNDGEDLEVLLPDVQVFPRVCPSSKLQIVRSLQASGQITAMIGDGINDAPALKSSHVGIAMGKNSTEAAKNAADMVVVNDDLSEIYYAIKEGRTIRCNMKKSIEFLLSTNLSEILVSLGSLTIGWQNPLSPLHLLWINLVTDVFPSLALALEQPDDDIMQSKAPGPDEPLFSKGDYRQMAYKGVGMTATTLGAYGLARKLYGPGAHANTIAFASLTFSQILHAFGSRSSHPFFSKEAQNRATNYWLLGACGVGLALLGGSIFTPGLRNILGNVNLGLPSVALVTGAGAGSFLMTEGMRSAHWGQSSKQVVH